ncbi:MAG TPA: type VI secretion system contractile sheath large subunit [Acetobacteraceae bacterium]|nr:type VI secretion system contractile sheath large subunit [Acetobacteraceae bacterium]
MALSETQHELDQPTLVLRDAMLAGRFFGAAHAGVAESLAAFLTDTSGAGLKLWFGPRAASLAGDRRALRGALDRDLVALDDMISAMLDEILHHPRLQKLEGSWRGLHWLANQIEAGGRIKLRALPLTWAEICRDLERAPEFDQSQLFRRVYEDEFGIAGGEPYGLLVMDYEVRHRPGPGALTDDVSALASLSAIAAAAFSPMIFSPAAALFGVDNLGELSGVADPASGFNALDYQRWRSLAGREDIRFIALAMPRLAARAPWREEMIAQRGFRYNEQCDDGADRVWFAAGYAVAYAVGRAFQSHGWPADIRGYEADRVGGGLVESEIDERFSIDPAEGVGRFAPEVALTDGQERALVEAGLMPLAALLWGGEVVLAAARSLQAPKRYTGPRGDGASANARLSAQFSTMICVARFAHFVKVMGRDMVGAFRTAEEIQRKLREWLLRYANANRSAGADQRARYPLLAADVTVSETPGKPGVYGCVIQLQPHFQLDDISASFRLVTELATPGGR